MRYLALFHFAMLTSYRALLKVCLLPGRWSALCFAELKVYSHFRRGVTTYWRHTCLTYKESDLYAKEYVILLSGTAKTLCISKLRSAVLIWILFAFCIIKVYLISGCGFGIRDPVPFWPLDPGSGMGFSGSRISDAGSRILNPYFLKGLVTIFWIKSTVILS